MVAIASFACGLIFGIGLLISGMTDPQKVLGFLDVFGTWDPTLAFVMAGALGVTAIGFTVAKRRGHPMLESRSRWPAPAAIDAPLVAGAILFGIGWGLVGLCPGPAIVNLGTGSAPVFLFVIAMLVGMALQKLWRGRTHLTDYPRIPAVTEAADR